VQRPSAATVLIVWFAANICILGLPLGATLGVSRLAICSDHRRDPRRRFVCGIGIISIAGRGGGEPDPVASDLRRTRQYRPTLSR
jgi:hypothetical protein